MSNNVDLMGELLKGSLQKKVKRGDIVDGVCVLVEDDKCFLDIKGQAEAELHISRYSKDPNLKSLKDVLKVGDTIKVKIFNVKEQEEKIEITADHLTLRNQEVYLELEEKFKNNEEITVVVDSLVKPKNEGVLSPGFNTYYKNVRCFLPNSQTSKDRKINDKIKVNIIELKPNSIVVSEKKQLEKAKKEELTKILANINEGDVIEAKVKRLIKTAAFLDLGGVDALLHISDISHDFVNDINDVIKVDDTLLVKVISKKDDKIQVSRRILLPTDFNLFLEKHSVGDVIKGKVQNKSTFGMFIELAKNVRGLLHKNEYSWNPNSNLDRNYAVGDEIEVKILQIDDVNEKISLSVRLLEDNPWERVDVKEGDIVEVLLTEIFDKGFIVDYKGANGFIPTSQILNKDQKGKIEDLYSVGDKISAKVIEFNPNRLKLVLSIRRVKEDFEKENYEKYLNDNQEDFTSNIS